MYIGIKHLQLLLKDYSVYLINDREPCCLAGFQFLKSSFPPYNEHYVYVASGLQGISDITDFSEINLIVLLNENETYQTLPTYHSSANILFLKGITLADLSKKLEDFFCYKCGIALYSDLLLSTLLHGNSIQQLVDESFTLFQNPIFVFDDAFYLMASTWEEARKSGYFDSLLNERWISDDSFDLVNQLNHVHKRMMQNDAPMIIQHSSRDFQQLICPISSHENLGHIVVCGINRPLSDFDQELILIMRNAIYLQLTKEPFYKENNGFHFEFFIQDMLDEKLAIGQKHIEFMNYIRPNFSGNMYCIVIEIARSLQTVNTFHIRKILENMIPDTKSLIYNGQIILLLNCGTKAFLSEKYIDIIRNICIKHGLFAGISNCFFDILQIRDYYKQALHAIEIGVTYENAPNLFLYKNYYLSHAVNIFQQKESLSAFCHPKLKILLDYDSKNHTDLAKTLYTYLIYERNSATTARVIQIHRNTLASRLKHIDSLVSIEYENPEERQYLIMSFDFYIKSQTKE